MQLITAFLYNLILKRRTKMLHYENGVVVSKENETISIDEKASNIISVLGDRLGDGGYYEIWIKRLVDRIDEYIYRYQPDKEFTAALWRKVDGEIGPDGPSEKDYEELELSYDQCMRDAYSDCI